MQLVWREEIEWYASPDKPVIYWRLVAADADEIGLVRVYAYITKESPIKSKPWQLRMTKKSWARGKPVADYSYHKTLKEAKALGIVNARFEWS